MCIKIFCVKFIQASFHTIYRKFEFFQKKNIEFVIQNYTELQLYNFVLNNLYPETTKMFKTLRGEEK